ncbi:hypothetical protein D9756_006570 [Leucocoprinus leucothites]|uniref:Succinate dehydrogenase assembly factor 2, mitochondrial n=1 Tax=Leucocoprinus leucothites TaxID=201217 RepID=A0A8H5G1X4_9AGAR|nr:hypothetical protein D9756_006570 [Leucoagaricus leucothites]
MVHFPNPGSQSLVLTLCCAVSYKMLQLALRNVARRHVASQSTRHISTTIRRSKDPWPLPHTPEHLASTVTPSDIPPPTPIPRPNEPVEQLRARLIYQSRKRGTLESDLLLSTFARDNLARMTEAELKEYDKLFEQLLDEPDWDIYYWCTEERTPPPRWANTELLGQLRLHAKNEGKVIRKMPALS